MPVSHDQRVAVITPHAGSRCEAHCMPLRLPRLRRHREAQLTLMLYAAAPDITRRAKEGHGSYISRPARSRRNMLAMRAMIYDLR